MRAVSGASADVDSTVLAYTVGAVRAPKFRGKLRSDEDVEIPAGESITLALKLEGVATDALTPIEPQVDPGLAITTRR